MRILALLFGMTAVTAASAAEFDTSLQDSDAVTAQFVYEARFGGSDGAPAPRAFRLQFASEAQRQIGLAPLRAEYVLDGGRADTGRFLVNGLDVGQMLIARQGEEGGGLSALWGGFFPLVLVVGAAALIVVDGYDQDFGVSGTGTGG